MIDTALLSPALAEAVEKVRPRWEGLRLPEGTLAVILGSGLGGAAERFPVIWERNFEELGLVQAGVAGHRGRLILAESGGAPLLFLQGRLHRYEGHADAQVLLPAVLLADLSPRAVLVTNAAGGMDTSFEAGDFMLIGDILSTQRLDPLRGSPETFGPEPRPAPLFDEKLAPGIRKAAAEAGIVLREGVLNVALGPTFETPAELRLARRMGAQAACMSTFPESVLMSRMGVPLAGISCITNVIQEDGTAPVTHEEVLETGLKAAEGFGRFLAAWASCL